MLREITIEHKTHWPEVSARVVHSFCSLLKVPIQAIRAVNDLVRTLAAVKARLNGQKSADLQENPNLTF